MQSSYNIRFFCLRRKHVASSAKVYVSELPANQLFSLRDWSLTWNGGNNFSNLQPVENGCFSCSVQPQDKNPHLSSSKQTGKDGGEKAPCKKQNRKAFQCQLAIRRIRKGRQINLISYWATRCFFSPVNTDKFRLSPRHVCWTTLYFHGFMLVFYGSSIQPNHVAAASSFLIVVRIFFSFSLICQNLSQLLFCLWLDYLFDPRDYTRAHWSLK